MIDSVARGTNAHQFPVHDGQTAGDGRRLFQRENKEANRALL